MTPSMKTQVLARLQAGLEVSYSQYCEHQSWGTEPQEDTLYILVGVNKVKFRKQVVPGDQVELYAELLKRKGNMWIFKTEAKVDGKMVTSAELMCAAVKGDAA